MTTRATRVRRMWHSPKLAVVLGVLGFVYLAVLIAIDDLPPWRQLILTVVVVLGVLVSGLRAMKEPRELPEPMSRREWLEIAAVLTTLVLVGWVVTKLLA